MKKLRILGAVSLAVLLSAPDAMAQRGGAARSGMRGAMVGGMVGGSSGAATGAKVGVVAGATRGVAERSADRRAMDSETQARTTYESTAEYQDAQHSDFNAAPPDVLVTSSSDQLLAPGEEAIVRKDGKPVVGISYPTDWKQKAGKNYVSAISPKRNAWSVIATLDGATDKDAGIKRAKEGIEKYIQDVEYDELSKTERGALLITGEGKGKKTGLPVVFAVGVFQASPEQLAGAAFVVDKNAEEHYKEAVRFMCQTIRGQQDFATQEHNVAKPVIK